MSGPATLERVPTASVVASPDQNRTVFEPAGMAELAASIDELGLLQPNRGSGGIAGDPGS